MSNLLASLGCTLNALQHVITKKSHVSSKFMILCWATFIAVLSCMQPAGRRLDTPSLKHHVKHCNSLKNYKERKKIITSTTTESLKEGVNKNTGSPAAPLNRAKSSCCFWCYLIIWGEGQKCVHFVSKLRPQL